MAISQHATNPAATTTTATGCVWIRGPLPIDPATLHDVLARGPLVGQRFVQDAADGQWYIEWYIMARYAEQAMAQLAAHAAAHAAARGSAG